MNRCAWVKEDPLEIAYHDSEWGVPVTDDQKANSSESDAMSKDLKNRTYLNI